MKHNLQFTIPTFTEEFDVFPIPDNEKYDYWVPLLKKFIEQSDTIEIHCWNDEKDHINEMTLLFKGVSKIVNEGNITVIKGKITDDISNHVLYDNVKTNGKLKWFSIFLSRNNTPVFQSEHWGTEFFAPNLGDDDIANIKSMTPADTNFYQYQ